MKTVNRNHACSSSALLGIIVLVACTAISVYPAQANDWLKQRAMDVECGRIRNEIQLLMGRWTNELWFASTDNSPDGWVGPFTIDSTFKDMQQHTAHFDWALQGIPVGAPDRVKRCKAIAREYATLAGDIIAHVLATGTRSTCLMGREGYVCP
jgi:hypothetical protein